MRSPMGFSRPLYLRAGGPRSQGGFSRPPHLRAGGPRSQGGDWVRSDGFQPPIALAGRRPAHPGGGALRWVSAAHRICGPEARAPRWVLGCTQMGFSRPPYLRARGPRTQVGSWVHSDGFQPSTALAGRRPAHPGGFSRPLHLRAGGPRTQGVISSSAAECFGSALSVSKSNLAQLFKSTTAPG